MKKLLKIFRKNAKYEIVKNIELNIGQSIPKHFDFKYNEITGSCYLIWRVIPTDNPLCLILAPEIIQVIYNGTTTIWRVKDFNNIPQAWKDFEIELCFIFSNRKTISKALLKKLKNK